MALLLTISYPLSCLITVGALVLAMACLGIVAWRGNFFRGCAQPTRALFLTGLGSALLLCFWAGVVNFQIFRETNQVMHERARLAQKISDLEQQRLSLVKSWSAACDESAQVAHETEAARLRVAELERQATELVDLEIENQALIRKNALKNYHLTGLQEDEGLASQVYEEIVRTKRALLDELEVKISRMHILRNEIEEREALASRKP